MRFESLENAEGLIIRFKGESLDAYSLGVIEVTLHEISEKVALLRLSDKGLLDAVPRRGRSRHQAPRFYPSHVIRCEVKEIKSGSFSQKINFKVAKALADRDVRALLQNLAASVIFSILACGAAGIMVDDPKSIQEKQNEHADDRAEVGSNVRDMIATLSENLDEVEAEIEIETEKTHRKVRIHIRGR